MILKNTDAGKRLATMLAHDISLFYVQLFMSIQICSSGTLKCTSIYITHESLFALMNTPDVLIQSSLRD